MFKSLHTQFEVTARSISNPKVVATNPAVFYVNYVTPTKFDLSFLGGISSTEGTTKVVDLITKDSYKTVIVDLGLSEEKYPVVSYTVDSENTKKITSKDVVSISGNTITATGSGCAVIKIESTSKESGHAVETIKVYVNRIQDESELKAFLVDSTVSQDFPAVLTRTEQLVNAPEGYLTKDLDNVGQIVSSADISKHLILNEKKIEYKKDANDYSLVLVNPVDKQDESTVGKIRSLTITGDDDSKIKVANTSIDSNLFYGEENTKLTLIGGSYYSSGKLADGVDSKATVILKDVNSFEVVGSSVAALICGKDVTVENTTLNTIPYSVSAKEACGIDATNVKLTNANILVDATTKTTMQGNVLEGYESYGINLEKNGYIKSTGSKIVSKANNEAYAFYIESVIKDSQLINTTAEATVSEVEDGWTAETSAATALYVESGSTSNTIAVSGGSFTATAETAKGLELAGAAEYIFSDISEEEPLLVRVDGKYLTALDAKYGATLNGGSYVALRSGTTPAEEAVALNFDSKSFTAQTLTANGTSFGAYADNAVAIKSISTIWADTLVLKDVEVKADSDEYAVGIETSGNNLKISGTEYPDTTSTITALSDDVAYGIYSKATSSNVEVTVEKTKVAASSKKAKAEDFVAGTNGLVGILNEAKFTAEDLDVEVVGIGVKDSTAVYGIYNAQSGNMTFGNGGNETIATVGVEVQHGGANALYNLGNITFKNVTGAFTANRVWEELGENNEAVVYGLNNTDVSGYGIVAGGNNGCQLYFVATTHDSTTGSDLNNIRGNFSSTNDVTFTPSEH